MTITRSFTQTAGAILLIIWSSLSLADIVIHIEDPQWEFMLNNQLPLETEAKLSANENEFARRIQPLLAKQDHSAILAAFSDRTLKDDSPALQLLRGQVLLSIQKYQQAETALKAALTKMPDLALAHRSLSMVYMVTKRYELARQHLQRSIELGVADSQVYGQLAFVNLQLEQAASAIAGYQYALFLAPNNKQWRQGLLFALIKSRANDQALALLNEMLQDDAANADLWLQRGQLALQQKHMEQAISSLETALQLGANQKDNIATMAQLHIQSGSPSRAVTLLADHIDAFLHSKQADLGLIEQIGLWLAHQQKWSLLAKLLNAVEDKSSTLASLERAKISILSAKLALHQQDSKKAQRLLNEALKADPANGEALIQLATLLQQQHQYDRSALYFIRAQALPAFKERALTGHAQLEIDRQNYRQALQVLRQLLAFSPRRHDVQANIHSLEQLVRQQGS